MKDTMTSSADRMRLKDKILTNVARAIKGIQEYQLCTGESEVILTNNSWHCHRLCEHLDHAFLHGLRHITHGYWKLVTEFTRKGAVKEIKRLQRITTDLGRGRAWLFLALNENLLESYMRCFLENTSIVKKYYVREALVLDHQRMNVLVTLTSGLDFASFQLEYDLPYLDLNASPPKGRSQSDTASAEDEDKVSLCSMESFASRNSLSAVSSSMVESAITGTDSDCGSVNSDNLGIHSDTRLPKLYHVGSLDSGYYCGVDISGIPHRHSGGSFTMSDSMSLSSISSNTDDCRFRRIENVMTPNGHLDVENNLEVIHVKSKVLKRKKRERSSIKKDVFTNNHSSICENLPVSPVITIKSTTIASESHHMNGPTLIKTDVLIKELKKRAPTDPDSQKQSVKDNTKTTDIILDNKTCEENNSGSQVDTALLPDKKFDSVVKTEDVLNDSPPTEIVVSDKNTDDNPKVVTEAMIDKDNLEESDDCNEVGEDASLGGYNADSSSSCEDKIKESPSDLLTVSLLPDKSLSQKASTEDVDIYNKSPAPQNHPALYKQACQDRDAFQAGNHTNFQGVPPEEGTDALEDNAIHCDPGQIMLDNHTLLYLMLEIIDENEKCLKMFVTREGQNEGQSSHIFVLVTDCSIYLLKQHNGDHKFIKESTIPFRELDYISLSVNSQVINIVCANRRHKFWMTTGDEEVTRSIINCLSHAMEASLFNIPKLSVLTDATSQHIAMKKYVAQETKASMHGVEIHSYQLIHWEDAQTRHGQGDWTYKEGYLLYRCQDYFRSYVWKPAYFILKDGSLCMYNNKTDSKPAAFINMGAEECTGCRRATDSDRDNTIEIILTTGHNWYLAAATALDANDWRQSFCQAASEVMLNRGVVSSSCIGCCVLLSQTKLLMCHEDLQTNFFRTLGSANIEDVTAVLQARQDSSYSLLEFESQEAGVSTERWILYFNSIKEKSKFTTKLSHCWKKLFQIELPITEIDDPLLMKKCSRRVEQLTENLTLYSS